MKYTVLVTGAGAIIGYGIIKALRQSGHNVRIVAIDIYNYAYGKHIADVFYTGVMASNEGFIDFINDIVVSENIDLIIPGIEQDLYALHGQKEKVKCPVVMNNDLCIELSKNKLSTFDFFDKTGGLNLIPTLFEPSYEDCVLKLGLPFLIKPISSYASKGIEIIKTQREFDFYKEKLNGRCVFQKIISSIDEEYTIAIFGDGNGSFYDHIILKRYLSQEGATSRAEIIENPIILDYINKIAELLEPVGPTNIQIRMEDNIPYLLEINPRISSACSIRTLFNYNEPEMCIDFFLEQRGIIPKPKRSGSVIRFIDDFVEYV